MYEQCVPNDVAESSDTTKDVALFVVSHPSFVRWMMGQIAEKRVFFLRVSSANGFLTSLW